MNGEPLDGIPGVPAAEPFAGWRRVVRLGENLIVALSLAALMALPLIEMVLRRFHSGLSGSTAFVQHFTLIVGMLGGAIAARDGRLLSFSSLASFLPERLRSDPARGRSACAKSFADCRTFRPMPTTVTTSGGAEC